MSETHNEGVTSLTDRAANSLIVNHLRRCGYEYTLAIFLPESGTTADEVFSSSDLLRLLGVRQDSDIHQKALSDSECKGLLWQLLSELARQHSIMQTDVAVQTDHKSKRETSVSLNAKLLEVEREFSKRQANRDESMQVQLEERMQAYQRQCNARAKAEASLQVEQFKETTLLQMRMQEQEKCQAEISRCRNEMELKYRENLEALHRREEEATERIRHQQQEQEAQSHAQRQSLLEELNVLRMREEAVKRDAELNMRFVTNKSVVCLVITT
jgi:oral-facial-digital syndrome 1 protein